MKCYKAKWILTSEDKILEDTALVVDEGKIVNLIPNSEVNFDAKYVKDLGNAVITPGFIDLLTQFQYTNVGKTKPNCLKNKLKRFFKNFSKNYNFAGVRADNYSLKWANILTQYFSFDRSEKLKSFDDGVQTAIKAGTTCVAQVSKEFKFFETINKLPIKTYLFFEVFSDTSEKSKKQFKDMRVKVEDLIQHKGEHTHIGIMLNSESGVHKKMWNLFSKYCRKHNMLLMTRFAESQDENEWLEHGFSDIDLLHKFMGLRKISPYSKELNPVEYLNNLKVLTNKVLAANANYLTESELEELAATGVKYIYQPYYSAEICNKKLDFETVLKYFKGNFGFSSQSFLPDKNYNLLEEAINADSKNILGIDELIKYLTIYPARILRLENTIGSIKIGKDADFNVFKIEEGKDYNAIKENPQPYATYSCGRKIVKKNKTRFSL